MITLHMGLYGGIIHLNEFEKKVFSQNGEDGVIEEIFNQIGVTNRYYVELGADNGSECNTAALRIHKGWKGLLIDKDKEDPKINLQKEFISAESVNGILKKYDVPKSFDLLVLDIDFNDWHVWRAISSDYQPRVVIVEYNATHVADEDKVVLYEQNGSWDYTNYFGASILAFYRLGVVKGYSLVYAESQGVNLFFIRNDILAELKTKGIEFANTNYVRMIYRTPKYSSGPNGGHGADPLSRPYAKARELLKAEYKPF